MRNIMFRGQEPATKKWYKGGYAIIEPPPVCFKEDSDRQPPAKHCIVVEAGCADWGMPRQYGMVEVDPATIGEYSDIPDTNGHLICEGDSLRVTRHCVQAYGIVVVKNGCFWFVDDGPSGMLRLCDAKMNNFELEVIDYDKFKVF